MERIKILKNTIFWGTILWFIGWTMGVMLYKSVPTEMIGWIISPIATLITIWVLFKKIHREKFMCYVGLGVIWTILAIILDYIFNVKLFNIANYYKLDIYIYYALTLILPIIVGLIKFRKHYGK